MKHELTGSDTAVINLIRRAIADNRDVVAVLQQPQCELQPRLAAADDRDFSHLTFSADDAPLRKLWVPNYNRTVKLRKT